MGLNFNSENKETTAAPVESEVVEVQPFDIISDKKELAKTMTGSKEVDEIASKIYIDDLDTIVSFGAEVAENISKSSDVILNSMNMSQIDDSGKMLNALAKIMDKFDIDEFKEKEGVVTLAPQEEFECQFIVEINQ